MSYCPTCGHQTTEELPMSALGGVCLSKQLRRILDVFVNRFGRPVYTEEIVEALYFDDPNGGAETAASVINVRLFELRRRILPLGFSIEGKRGKQGRRLVRVANHNGGLAA